MYVGIAQESTSTEDLQNQLHQQSGIQKIKTLDELTYRLSRRQDSSGIRYALQGLELSRKEKYVKGEVDAINLLGRIAMYQLKPRDAEKYFNQAFEIAKKESYAHGIARGYNEFGLLYREQGETVKAIDAFLSSSESFEEQGNIGPAIKANYNLGDLYIDFEAYSDALKYYLKSLELSKKLKDSLSLARVYKRLAWLEKERENYKEMLENALKAKQIFADLERPKDVYITNILLGISYDYLDQNGLALVTYRETLDMAEKLQIDDLSDLYNNYAMSYNKVGSVGSALYFYTHAQKSFKEDNDLKRLSVNYNNLGNLYMSEGENEKALTNFQQSLALQKKVKDSSLLQKTYYSLGEFYKKQKEYKTALLYKDSSDHILQIIHKKIKKADRYELSYLKKARKLEAEKSQAELLVIDTKRKNQVVIIILIAVILLFFAILRSRKLKQAKKLAELAYEQQKVEAQLEREQQEKKLEEMLQEQERKAINSMVSGQEEERARIAKDLHDRLGSMLSVVKIHYKSVEDDLEKIKKETKTQYEKANKLLDEACEAVRKIAHNMVSGTLTKFGLVPALKELKEKIEETKTLQIELLAHGLDDRLDNTTEIQLYRVVQELLNNVLKHAEATEVTIQLLKREHDVNIMVTDNGIGFEVDEILNEGMGLKSVKARIAEMDGRVLIDSSKGNGTTVTIEIPT
jgi:signal transduction histidine kinase